MVSKICLCYALFNRSLEQQFHGNAHLYTNDKDDEQYAVSHTLRAQATTYTLLGIDLKQSFRTKMKLTRVPGCVITEFLKFILTDFIAIGSSQ